MHALTRGTLILAALMVVLPAARLSAVDEPVLRNGRLIFPENAVIPRYLTEAERRYLETHPLGGGPRGDNRPPTGPVHCAAEYEPMEGIVIAWEAFTTILKQMAAEITTVGDADLYVSVDSSGEQNSAYNELAGYGIDMDRVHFVIHQTDTVWIRDYGPRYIFEGNCRAIVDHTYNRPRPNDNLFNGAFSEHKNHAIYEIPLIHGGGNYHLNALDEGNASRLIANENPGLTDEEIIGYWRAFQNVVTTLWTPLPNYIDSTQHIDMWMQIVADDVIILSDWPNDEGSTQDQICDNAAADFLARGWDVYRTPARRVSYTHYTYTNMVVCNDLILLPYYTNSSVSPHNSEALAAVQAACPDKTVVQINCQAIIGSAGAIHCIVMHVPEPAGGEDPTVYLKNLRGGEILNPQDHAEINWISDDNIGTTGVDILLSIDGGENFDTTIIPGTADDGSHVWVVPDIYTTQARLRLVIHDADGNVGTDESDADFTINGTPPVILGDMDCDGDLDLDDVPPFSLALVDPAAYQDQFNCDINRADLNQDQTINSGDIQPFLTALLEGP